MRHQNTHDNAGHEPAARTRRAAPGRAQTAAPPDVAEDVETIRELLEQIGATWPNLTPQARESLAVSLAIVRAAAKHRDTDARPVREALQHILLTVGTGAVATLSDPARRRLEALTGIALNDRGPHARNPDDRNGK